MKNRIEELLIASMLSIVLGSQLLMGCGATNTTKGGAIGAGAGGAIGGVIGHQSGNTVVGAIIGAAVGGTAGALIGRHMDKQAEELKADLKGAKVERVGEGILITFDSGLLFEHGSYGLRSTTKANLTDLGKTLNKYDDTNILIEGHTDNTGKNAYNQTLSEERADNVKDYLVVHEIKVILINLSVEQQIIQNGDRIAQMVIQKFINIQWLPAIEINESERGTGGFGHTGKS